MDVVNSHADICILYRYLANSKLSTVHDI